jgi:ABC-type polysaccharide/polyol phosphate transport system ATPase subunit
MTTRPLAISVASVSKDFRLPSEQRHTLKERVINPRFDRSSKAFHALRDINFEVERGEFFGIVGRNGSGKSTLLKCMAGIYKIDAGSIKIGGRVSTFIELGVGFNPDLAARDNIILNGIMLGLSPKEAAGRVDEVIAFAELEDHVDLKLKNYSSGMQVRLAFSVMTQIEADVLLIDEVLAVGDAAFQAKCFGAFQDLRDAGKTVVLVTHDMGAVANTCDRAMVIEDGVMVDLGDPRRIATEYLELNFGRGGGDALHSQTGDRLIGSGDARITETWFANAAGEHTNHLPHGERFTLNCRVRIERDIDDPVIAFRLDNREHVTLFASGSVYQGVITGRCRAGETYDYSITLSNPFTPGEIAATAWVSHHTSGEIVDLREAAATARVSAVTDPGGVIDLPHEARWQRTPAEVDVAQPR